MAKEEQVLFPYIGAVETASISGVEPPMPFFGTVRNPVRNMMLEHDSAAEILRELRVVTSNYSSLFMQLGALETDLHHHIHLENNILFPRAIETEEKARVTPVPLAFANHVCGGDHC
jgi:regulator of cell morphogenesis and NO signaling